MTSVPSVKLESFVLTEVLLSLKSPVKKVTTVQQASRRTSLLSSLVLLALNAPLALVAQILALQVRSSPIKCKQHALYVPKVTTAPNKRQLPLRYVQRVRTVMRASESRLNAMQVTFLTY